MAKLNRKCIVCGKEYSYCPSCGADSLKPTWMTIYHDENCHDIFNIIRDYKTGILSKEVAHTYMSQCCLVDKVDFKDSVREAVDEIMAVEKTEETTEEVVEEKPTPKKKRATRKTAKKQTETPVEE